MASVADLLAEMRHPAIEANIAVVSRLSVWVMREAVWRPLLIANEADSEGRLSMGFHLAAAVEIRVHDRDPVGYFVLSVLRRLSYQKSQV